MTVSLRSLQLGKTDNSNVKHISNTPTIFFPNIPFYFFSGSVTLSLAAVRRDASD